MIHRGDDGVELIGTLKDAIPDHMNHEQLYHKYLTDKDFAERIDKLLVDIRTAGFVDVKDYPDF